MSRVVLAKACPLPTIRVLGTSWDIFLILAAVRYLDGSCWIITVLLCRTPTQQPRSPCDLHESSWWLQVSHDTTLSERGYEVGRCVTEREKKWWKRTENIVEMDSVPCFLHPIWPSKYRTSSTPRGALQFKCTFEQKRFLNEQTVVNVCRSMYLYYYTIVTQNLPNWRNMLIERSLRNVLPESVFM